MSDETMTKGAQAPRRPHSRRAITLPTVPGLRPASDDAGMTGLSYLKLLDQLEQAQLELNRLPQLIHVDELCGVGNRRAFSREMERAQALAERHGMPCHLAIIDVDGFKEINDRFGHAAGDFILSSLAALIRSNIRRADALCRLGGDEFAVIFYGIDEGKLCAKIDRLMRSIADAPFEFAGKRIGLTVSIGFSSIEFDAASTFTRADAAMYEVKRLRGGT